ncbi:hypothetical protein [Actinoplanes awajinensis]|uniref:Uncharacterized protein n=1 Tax=Actinoplanes awajinensis subsp. mycoplanecinus TaxID=135947 RepID=A0A101JPG1_9ACTN|nr:hypothetical protein [Actinoplanes awajinensis]KUL30748.1 hypothetical protein ADL15_24180 [Actinoplanes awajinensis subsp. mycoplanecinus]
MSYAGSIRPVVDRLYIGVRASARERVLAVYAAHGLRPGFESSFYFGLLARPMPADGFAAATTYGGADMTGELEQGIAEVDADGTWRLTDRGRAAALAVQQALGDTAAERWSPGPPFDTVLPGPASVPRLADLVGRLLAAGQATGGPAFRALAPVHEPPDASPAVRLTTRLGALRHHRADAHRAAWQAAGLTVDQVRALPAGPERQALEDETNRRDEPIYQALDQHERLELLAGLGALP